MEALLITTADVKKYTALNGNLDNDKFIHHVKIAQDIHIEKILGSKLMQKIKSDIVADTLTGDYLNLVNVYIKPCLIHYTMVEYLPFGAYTIANGGVFKHTSENSENAVKEEVDFLIGRSLSTAEHYRERLIKYLCVNSTLFPEYTTNELGDVYPSKQDYSIGWVL